MEGNYSSKQEGARAQCKFDQAKVAYQIATEQHSIKWAQTALHHYDEFMTRTKGSLRYNSLRTSAGKKRKELSAHIEKGTI